MILRKAIPYPCSVFLYFLITALFSNCSKQEKVWQYHIEEQKPPPPPATGKDTTISVTALLNNDTFKALGRAEPPSGKLIITFTDLSSSANLKLELGADTPGVYHMNRDISAHTALWYNVEGKSFTSRATDEAGGTVTILETDTITHRIKGNFELLLSSRTEPVSYHFSGGKFDILYNHFTLTLDDKTLNLQPDETVKTTALNTGSASAPQPGVFLQLNDSTDFNLVINQYAGTGDYEAQDKDKLTFQLIYKRTGKIFTAHSGTVSIIRFNYGQFLQVLFDGMLQAEDGTQVHITNGSAVIGL